MVTKQSPTNQGLFFGGINCLVVFPTHFNPNNSFLHMILLQIRLLFMFTAALSIQVFDKVINVGIIVRVSEYTRSAILKILKFTD